MRGVDVAAHAHLANLDNRSAGERKDQFLRRVAEQYVVAEPLAGFLQDAGEAGLAHVREDRAAVKWTDLEEAGANVVQSKRTKRNPHSKYLWIPILPDPSEVLAATLFDN